MEIIKGIAYVVIFFALAGWLSSSAWFEREARKNLQFEAPSDDQIKWHITHMREDIGRIAIVQTLLLFLIVGVLVFKI